ncbi:MAG: type I-F CRISPR-associated protein Csy2, partial [Pseudobdellovibrionaceae bacterium]
MNDGLIVLKRIIVENANAISGVTWGFPAITNFLGFVHTISRKLKNQYDISLSGCAVISHEQHVHVHRPKKYGDFYFAMTRNPLTKKGETSPFNPEGRMHMTVSLVIPFFGRLPKNKNNLQEFTKHLKKIVCESRLAGGTIISFQDNVLADYYPE